MVRMQVLVLRIGTITFGIRIGTLVVGSLVTIFFVFIYSYLLYGTTFVVSFFVLRKQIHLGVCKIVSSENQKQKTAFLGKIWERNIKIYLIKL